MRAENYDRERLEMWRAKLNAPPPPPLEAATSFLSSFFADDSWDEARDHIESLASQNPRFIITGLNGIEALLKNSPQEGVLADLVAWEANQVLEDPSDEGAKVWLRKVAEMIREILGNAAPPRPSKV